MSSSLSTSGSRGEEGSSLSKSSTTSTQQQSKKKKKKYLLGEVARTPRDMIIHRSTTHAIHQASLLAKYDQAFLKRSNGLWTASVLADRGMQPKNSASSSHWYTADEIEEMEKKNSSTSMEVEESMLFVINEDGATKIVKRRHWGKFIRCIQE